MTMRLRSDPYMKLPTSVNIAQKISPRLVAAEKYVHLQELKVLPPQEQEQAFLSKLILCRKAYNFEDDSDQWEKDVKQETLKELIEYVLEEENVKRLTQEAYVEMVSMLKHNIFRTFPPVTHLDYDPEWDESVEEAAWPHLKLVYDLFLHFVTSTGLNVDHLRVAVDRPFMVRLLEIFDSEDARERRALRNILLVIYLKFPEQRKFLRKHIRHVFLRYVYETEQFNGIAELLDIFHMVINGFHLPIRPEHKAFLSKVLIPLHKPRYLTFYHKELVECLKGFIMKEEETAQEVLEGLLKFWPKTCSEKEILFLREIGDLSSVVSHEQFVKVEESLSKCLAECIASVHYYVAEAALNLWDNVDFLRLAGGSLGTIMPILFPSVFRASRDHWNNIIATLASTLLRGFSEADPNMYEDLLMEEERKLYRRREEPLE